MFEGLLVHAQTKKQLESFVSRPAQALLINGPAGSGKKLLAKHLSAALLNTTVDRLGIHPQFFIIDKEASKSEISIDSARRLVKSLSLKVPGEQTGINRVAIIYDADLLSTEAQNALLKLLEEPPAASLIIMTTSSADKLLPTVLSRLQTASVLPVGLEQAGEFYGSLYDKTDVNSAWQLSRGAPALMSALLSGGSQHQLKLAVEDAKQLLRLEPYDRLIYIQRVSKDKNELVLRLDALSRVLAVLHRTNITTGKTATSTRLLKARQLVNQVQESLSHNANVRLAALDLSLNMPL